MIKIALKNHCSSSVGGNWRELKYITIQVKSFAEKVQVVRDSAVAVTRIEQFPFFIEFLKLYNIPKASD